MGWDRSKVTQELGDATGHRSGWKTGRFLCFGFANGAGWMGLVRAEEPECKDGGAGASILPAHLLLDISLPPLPSAPFRIPSPSPAQTRGFLYSTSLPNLVSTLFGLQEFQTQELRRGISEGARLQSPITPASFQQGFEEDMNTV